MPFTIDELKAQLRAADAAILSNPPQRLVFVSVPSSDPRALDLDPSPDNASSNEYLLTLQRLSDEYRVAPPDLPLQTLLPLALFHTSVAQRLTEFRDFLRRTYLFYYYISINPSLQTVPASLDELFSPFRTLIRRLEDHTLPNTVNLPLPVTAVSPNMTSQPLSGVAGPSGHGRRQPAASLDANHSQFNNNDHILYTNEPSTTVHIPMSDVRPMRAYMDVAPDERIEPVARPLNVYLNSFSSVAFDELNDWYKFHSATPDLPQSSATNPLNAKYYRGSLSDLLNGFESFQIADYASIGLAHTPLLVRPRWRAAEWIPHLTSHLCDSPCSQVVYCFVRRNKKRYSSGKSAHRKWMDKVAAWDISSSDLLNDPYHVPSDNLRDEIIREWQSRMSTENQRNGVCACCSRQFQRATLSQVDVERIDFTLLRNQALAPSLLPTSYNLAAYDNALLNPKGLSNRDSKQGKLSLCKSCKSDLTGKKPQMPLYLLANWLYYARDRLPDNVKTAFNDASLFELALISRARASRTTFRYFQHSPASQFYSKGNVLVMPQDAISLTDKLPPSADAIRDSLCVLFIGHGRTALKDNIKKLSPCLVRKARILLLIQFLLQNNPHYTPMQGFDGLNLANLEALSEEPVDFDEAFTPAAVEIARLDPEKMPGEVEVTSDYTTRNERDNGEGTNVVDSDLIIENVGYTDGDTSPTNFNLMKLKALQHCVDGKAFLQSKAGSQLIGDFENPSLLSWLFPHLDPWGIGGFHDPRRGKRSLSMEQQLRYLVSLDDASFAQDPRFAFVYQNIVRKKMAVRQSLARVKRNQHTRFCEQLSSTPIELLKQLEAKYEQNSRYVPISDEEKAVVRMLSQVHSLNNRLPGSNGFKKQMRNEIRSLTYRLGAPALFITLNPSDVNNPLIRLVSGEEIDLEDTSRGEDMSKFRRQLLVAKNPHVAANVFDRMIKAFLDVVLRFGKKKPGLFGKCTGYYGSVEAQGKGTLHCHFLVWLEGHLAPQALRDRMTEDDTFKARVFAYLESIIQCELPGTDSVVEEDNGDRERVRDPTKPNPAVTALPQISQLSSDAFEDAYRQKVIDLVLETSLHKHTDTCFKNLTRGEPRNDATCRMRINGDTRTTTDLDPETQSIRLRRLDARINSHNNLLTFLLQCNNDIKFVGSGEAAKALLFYITDYITKTQLPTHVGLSAIRIALEMNSKKFDGDMLVTGPTVQRSLFVKVANGILSRMELSHQQVMSHIHGLKDHYSSHRFQALLWGAVSRRLAKALGESNLLETVPVSSNPEVEAVQNAANESAEPAPPADTTEDDVDDAEEVLVCLDSPELPTISQYDDYIYRPRDGPFSECSLYEFVQKFQRVGREKVNGRADSRRTPELVNDVADEDEEVIDDVRFEDEAIERPRTRVKNLVGNFLPEHPSAEAKRLAQRTREVVPVILGPSIPNPLRSARDRELWSRAIVVLFKPWRTPADLKSAHESWSDAYERLELPDRLQDVVSNLVVFEECRDARDADAASRRIHRTALLRPNEFEDDATDAERLAVATEMGDAMEAIGGDMAAALDEQVERDLVERRDLARLLGDVSEDDVNERENDTHSTVLLQEEGEKRLKEHGKLLKDLKKTKRGHHLLDTDSEEEDDDLPQSRQKRRHTEAIVELAVLQDGGENAGGRYGPLFRRRDPRDVVEYVIDSFGLTSNPEQLLAFKIVAERILQGKHAEQLLMYVGGVGGTGKSYLIRAIVDLFKMLGRRNELELSAPTGAAGVIIDGTTIHSLTGLPQKGNVNVNTLEATWRGITFLVLDEISMVGANLLAQISQRLSTGKGVEGAATDRPFGGIHVLFLGDFGQLKPVATHCLYSNELVGIIASATANSLEGQTDALGAFIWRQVKDVVLLQKNQRQEGDPLYAAILARVRDAKVHSQYRHGPNSDHAFLSRRLLTKLSQQERESFDDAPVIVGLKTVRDAVNLIRLRRAASRLGEPVHHYHSVDKIAGDPVPHPAQLRVWQANSTMTKDHLGVLPLFHGMKVMITENVAISGKLVNGAEGTVYHIDYGFDSTTTQYRVANTCYVRVAGSGVQLDGFPPDVVPIIPTRSSWVFKTRFQDHYTISRFQLPLLPAYSYTDYKSQGRTLEKAIVDLRSARSLQGLYVMLSRVKSVTGLAILREFPIDILEQNLSEETRQEFRRLAALRDETKDTYRRLLEKEIETDDYAGLDVEMPSSMA